jgi:hypothetical protein
MKTMAQILQLCILLLFTAISAVAQITSAGNGNWSDGTTWVGNIVPTSADNVVIASGHTVAVDDANAQCNNISFGDATAKLDMSTSSSVLSVYGNFTIASNVHVAFSSWTSGAKVKFTGSAIQTLSGWGTSTTDAATTFMEMQVDKTGGKVTTPGTDIKLNIGNSLEIINGTFELGSTDDIQGRILNGTSALSPDFIVYSGGTFTMVGGASHIRRANNTGTDTKRIGRFILHGSANFTTTSTNFLNFDAVEIESGGVLTINTISTGCLNPDTVYIKAGGTLVMSTTNNVWITSDTCAVDLQTYGTYKVETSTTNFPPTFINNGTVRYQRTASDGAQTIVDMDYYRLEISFAGSGTGNKTWTLGANRTVADSLEINNSARFNVKSASARTLNVNGVLRLTSGTFFNIPDSNVTVQLTNGATISRATGTITNAPTFGSSVNVRYTSTASNVTSGPELPTLTSVLNNLDIVGSQGMTLGSNATVNGILTFGGSAGSIITNANTLTLASGASITGEQAGRYVVGNLATTRAVGTGSSTFGGIGVELASGTDDLGDVTVTRVSGSNGIVTVNDNSGIARNWTIVSDNPPTSGRDVTFTWVSSDDNSKDISSGTSWRSVDGGTSWSQQSSGDFSSRSVSLSSQTVFGQYTISDAASPLPVELVSFTASVKGNRVELRWSTATEVNNYGFEIQRAMMNDELGMKIWSKAGFVEGNGTINTAKEYSFTDNPNANGRYEYRLKQIDRDGKFTYSNVVEAAVNEIPTRFGLEQNYPNPFNPATMIRFVVPNDQQVTVKVYNLLGQEIAVLYDGVAVGGQIHEVNFNASTLSAGVYYYTMKTTDRYDVKKMMLMK